MILKKTVKVEATTTDGRKMVEGTNYIIVLSDRSMCGTYRGITKKSALMFNVPLKDEKISFNIMPSSISKIFEATIVIKKDYMNEPEMEAAHEN